MQLIVLSFEAVFAIGNAIDALFSFSRLVSAVKDKTATLDEKIDSGDGGDE